MLERAGIARGDTALTNDINDALRELTRQRSWPWLARSAEYDLSVPGAGSTGGGLWGSGSAGDPIEGTDVEAWVLPTDFRQYVSVTVGGIPVRYMQPQDVDAGFGGTGVFIDAVNGSIVFLNPDRTSSAVLRYDAFEAVLVGDSDEPAWPDQYVDVLINLCCANILYGRNKIESSRSDGYRRRVERGLRQMARNSDPSQGGPRHHRVSNGAPY